MTAPAQAFLNSWIHLLRDATGIGTLETGWDGEGNCRRSSQDHVLVEMQFVPGVGRAQQGAAAWPGSGRECTHPTHRHHRNTELHQPGSLGHPLTSACSSQQGSSKGSLKYPKPTFQIGKPHFSQPGMQNKKQREAFWMWRGKRDAFGVLETNFLK